MRDFRYSWLDSLRAETTFRRKHSAKFTATGKKTGKSQAAQEIIVVWTDFQDEQGSQDVSRFEAFQTFELRILLEAI